MTKYDRNFCKPDEDMRPLYCPLPLAVVIHHHEEWDEPAIDPETGEPTGETEHKTADWDERRTEVFPSAEDKARMGYLPLSPNWPVDPAPDGQHWERTDKIERDGDGYKWVYTLVDNPPPPPRRWSSLAIKRVLEARGSWAQVKGLLETAGLYDDFLMADYIAEDDEAFLSARAEAVKLYGEETVAAILDTIPQEAG